MRVPDSIEAVLDTLGVDVTRVGDKETSGRCPMHEVRTGKPDNNPSWSINNVTGAHICYSCGYGGSLQHLVKDLTGDDSPSFLRSYRSAAIERLVGEKPEPVAAKEDPYVSERVLQKFAEPSQRQLTSRALSARSAAFYGLRWNRAGKHWVIPIRNAMGELMGWQEKSHGYFNNVPEGMKKSQALFGFDVYRGGTAILVESPLDVVRLHTVGINGGLAAYGAMVSEAQMRLIIASSDRLLLALDNDSAGRDANERIWKTFSRRIPIKFMWYQHTKAKDVGDMTDSAIRTAISRASILHWRN